MMNRRQSKVRSSVIPLLRPAKGKRIGKVSIFDGTGVAMLVNFGRRIGIMKGLLPVDTEVVVSGKFTRRYNEIQATDYEFELFEEGDETQGLIHTKRIVPKYPLTSETHSENDADVDADRAR